MDVSGDGGVLLETKSPGAGPSPKQGQVVFAHYTGTLPDGQVFDSSVGKPHRVDGFYFALGEGCVIRGWDVGFANMKVGEKATLTIRADYAYGERGGGGIPGGATLVFEVELLEARDMSGEEIKEQDRTVASLW